MNSSSRALFYTISLIIIIFTSTATAQAPFKCTTPTTCEAIIDYIPANATTYSAVKTLFGIKNLRSLFGANSLPLNTSPTQTIPPKQKTKIPFPCICNNGTGISNKRPIYTVKPGDGLDFIARTVYSNLLKYQQIVEVNNIKDPNKIDVGQKFVIPLPCSCDDVDGMKVVHYGFVVPTGSSVDQIATQFETNSATLLRLNDLASPNDLMADSVLDVPLRACNSSINTTSLDYPLLVPNGTYTFTANNCVQCTCQKSNNWILQCDPSPEGVKTPNWPKCPSMQCASGLSLGKTTSSSSCGVSTCSYTGYNNQTILTSVIGGPTCTSKSLLNAKWICSSL
ncbi:hypothetical protein ACHQM5_023527 [Ranunculus cassubicifolius]